MCVMNAVYMIGNTHFDPVWLWTWDEAMASNISFCKDIDSLNENSPPPVKADAQGRYPTPVPGQWSEI